MTVSNTQCFRDSKEVRVSGVPRVCYSTAQVREPRRKEEKRRVRAGVRFWAISSTVLKQKRDEMMGANATAVSRRRLPPPIVF